MRERRRILKLIRDIENCVPITAEGSTFTRSRGDDSGKKKTSGGVTVFRNLLTSD
jgi:hypothetical protein